MMEIRQLRCFAACVEMGSFTAAAEVLYTTQSAVSKTVHAMEKEVQAKYLYLNDDRGLRMRFPVYEDLQ
mgnify:CR=1 FL=1